MDRRKFLALVGSSVTVPSALGLEAVAETKTYAPRKRKGPPNVIVMICDDLGFGDLGCYGSNLPTPHLDAMAAHGARFAKYNSTHPICSASRAAVLTGRYGHRSGTTGAFGPHSPYQIQWPS